MNLKYFSPKTDPKINWEKVDKESLQMLDYARGIAGVPFVISSNHRTKEQDMKLAGFTGAHTEEPCTAFDITFKDKKQAFHIVRGCFAAGFQRIGINYDNNHVHVDNSKTLPSPRIFFE